MATVNEVKSLDEIFYKSKIKAIFFPFILTGILIFSFLGHYPVGDEIKSIMKKVLQGQSCNPSFKEIKWEWFLPKIVINDINLPASCFNQNSGSINLSYLNLNFNLISFSPFGIPFRIDTELSGQPLSFYYVQGFGENLIRIKDQTLKLDEISKLLLKVKLTGTITLDLNLLLHKNKLSEFNLKTRSRDLILPSQNLYGFNFPSLRMNEFFIELQSETSQKINVSKFILGDPDSPIRANLTGKIDVQAGNLSLSNLNLKGEIAFTENFKSSVPIDAFLGSYTQKDGFYQIGIGGNLSAPSLVNP